MALNLSVVLLVLLIEGSTNSHSIVSTSVDPFDGGLLSSCEKPSFKRDSICSDVVNYTVPTPITRLVAVIESSVSQSLDEIFLNEDLEECKDRYRKVICRHRFPKCIAKAGSSNKEVIINEHYTEELCGDVAERVSNVQKRYTLDETCSPISELAADFNFRRCSVNEENLVTPWMLEYLKAVDLTLSHESAALYSIPGCGKRFAFHKCNFIGRCSSEGRVEFINSYDSCRSATNW